MTTLSEGTKEVLKDLLVCPICHEHSLNIQEAILTRTERLNYRKTKYVVAECANCSEQGRGEVSVIITQRF